MSSGILGHLNTDVAIPLATQTAAARNAPVTEKISVQLTEPSAEKNKTEIKLK